MKKNLQFCSAVLLFVLCGVQEPCAQLAFASNRQKSPNISPQENVISVFSLLRRLETIHKVSFVYQQEIIEGKTVPLPVNENDRVESILERILPPVNLKFKKLTNARFIHAAIGVAKNELSIKKGIVFAPFADGSATEHQEDVPLPGR